MTIGVLKETGTENRVAVLPAEVVAMKKMRIDVLVETNAGEKAYATDSDYTKAGAVIASRKEVISGAEMLLSVNPPIEDDINSFREGQVLCSVLNPIENSAWLEICTCTRSDSQNNQGTVNGHPFINGYCFRL
jgi:NAD(P) transhydrogenase subunit alpha